MDPAIRPDVLDLLSRHLLLDQTAVQGKITDSIIFNELRAHWDSDSREVVLCVVAGTEALCVVLVTRLDWSLCVGLEQGLES